MLLATQMIHPETVRRDGMEILIEYLWLWVPTIAIASAIILMALAVYFYIKNINKLFFWTIVIVLVVFSMGLFNFFYYKNIVVKNIDWNQYELKYFDEESYPDMYR